MLYAVYRMRLLLVDFPAGWLNFKKQPISGKSTSSKRNSLSPRSARGRAQPRQLTSDDIHVHSVMSTDGQWVGNFYGSEK